MAFDAHKNFAYSTVLTAPSPAISGTSVVVQSGDGAKFPAASFNATIWPAGSQPTTANAEIVRVTNVSTDTFMITRMQESTSARTVVVGDQISAPITAKTLTDVEIFGGFSTATVATSQTTTSATYADLSTVGPAVTVNIGQNGNALVTLSSYMLNAAGGDESYMGFAVSGNSTVAAADTSAMFYQAFGNNGETQYGITVPITGLTPGSNTFTAKYRVTGSTGTYKNRVISVLPL